MKQLETDYLVIGSGAVSMAFVDTMLEETDASFIMVDRHHMPGGHWNDAYPFVRLHQPSAFYGVASTDLGSGHIDQAGSNQGFYELASGPEVSAYFDKVMRERFLSSGRVRYFPMHDFTGDGRFMSVLSGEQYSVSVRKRTVDGTFFNTSVPSMHERKFTVDADVDCVAPNDLPRRASGFAHFTVLGGGKTAMDAIVWLLEHGAQPDSIEWVCPRASWLIDRTVTQPGKAFFESTVGGIASQMESIRDAESVRDLFTRMEAAGFMVRLDPSIEPTMFHYATISKGEVEQLRRVKNVHRGQRVQHLAATGMTMTDGTVTPATGATLYIDCTATAVEFMDQKTVPIFEPGKITLQATLAPLVTYSAAVIAYVEANFEDDEKKNAMCAPVELADTPYEWMLSTLGNMMNQYNWSQDKKMRAWVNNCRLNPASAAIVEGAMADTGNAEIMNRLGQAAMPAVANLHKLIAAEAMPA